MLFLKGFEKGYHLSINSNGSLDPVKNSKGCCCSKAVARETREDRLALIKLEENFKNHPNIGDETLKLYSAVQSKRKRVDSLISGFVNWIKSLFRSKAYNSELKLLRSELDKFATLFSKKQLIDSITVKYFPPGQARDANFDKQTFEKLKKEVPQLFNNRSAINHEEFKQAPFFINQVGDKYRVLFAPVGDQPPESVEIDRLEQLPNLEKRENGKTLRERAKRLYQDIKSEHQFFDLSSDYGCEKAFEKVELDFLEDHTDLSHNELTIAYYKVNEGKVSQKVDLNAIASVTELKTLIQECKQKSLSSKQAIEARQAEIQAFILGLNLGIKPNLFSKEFEVTIDCSCSVPKVKLPFNLSLDEAKKQLEKKLQALYVQEQNYPGNPSKIVAIEEFKGINAQGLEAEVFGIKLSLEWGLLEVHYADFKNNENVSQTFLTAINFPDVYKMDKSNDRSKISEITHQVEKERANK